MEKLEHPLWIVQFVNALLGPLVRRVGEAMGHHFSGHDVIPNYIVMVLLIVLFVTAAVPVRALSPERGEPRARSRSFSRTASAPCRVCSTNGSDPRATGFCRSSATLGLFILLGNYMGLVPGLMAPTSSINVTLGCAMTIWVYYHYQGIKAQGIVGYVKHFWAPPGAPLSLGFLMFPIELISHTSRLMSLSLRLFGNIFGEELVILVLFSIVPFLVPLPMMFLGPGYRRLLQAFIFMLLSIIYLQGAVAVEHHADEHGHDAPHGRQAPAAA